MFSDYFGIDSKTLTDYGALNISLIADIPMYIDPILIFNSQKDEYKILHSNIINYMLFLAEKSKQKLTAKEIKVWFTFKEICNNWLGVSMSGNKGHALSDDFGQILYKNMSFIIENNNITKGLHSEKIMLIYPGSGKDKISDMTVNMIKDYLCEYTQTFALNNMTSGIKKFYVDKAKFNHVTETFESEEYTLPYIINQNGKEEYILLTPLDILRCDEPAINRQDFLNNMQRVRATIENDSLRIQLDNYIQKAINEYIASCRNLDKIPKERDKSNIEKEAFEEFAKIHKEIFDFYVKLKENDKSEIEVKTKEEVSKKSKIFIENVKILISEINDSTVIFNTQINSFEEAKLRIEFFKNKIENNDCYKLFYSENADQIIHNENDLQRMFKFVWYGSIFKNDAETNNGRGPADFVISRGSNDTTVIEFKLAKNSKLKNVFEQVQIYDKANDTENHCVVIFYFNDSEYSKTQKILKDVNKSDLINENVYLIDCRPRESASKVVE